MRYMKFTCLGVGAFAAAMAAAGTLQAAILITEIMYNSAGGNEYEFVELYNNGASAVDLSGYTIADTGATNSGPFAAGSSIAAGGTAVLPRQTSAATTVRTIADYQAAWGNSINFIEIPDDTWNGLANSGDQVLIYDASNNLVTDIDYGVASPWPTSTDGHSIYLTNLSADPSDGSNWALSAVGVDGAYQGSAPRADDVGSPGVVPVIPEPASLALAGLGCIAILVNRRRTTLGNK